MERMPQSAGNSTAKLYADRDGKSGTQVVAAGKVFAGLDSVARRKEGA